MLLRSKSYDCKISEYFSAEIINLKLSLLNRKIGTGELREMYIINNLTKYFRYHVKSNCNKLLIIYHMTTYNKYLHIK